MAVTSSVAVILALFPLRLAYSQSAVVQTGSDTLTFLQSLTPVADVDAGGFVRYNKQEPELNKLTGTYASQAKTASKELVFYTLGAHLGILGQRLLSFEYQSTIPRGGFSEEALRTSVDRHVGLEKYGLSFAVDPLVRALAPDATFLQIITSLQLRYVRELTETSGSVVENSVYVPLGAAIDYRQNTSTNCTALPAGSTYQYRTLYEYTEVTLRLPILRWIWDAELEELLGIIRVGYCFIKYGRPLTTGSFLLNGQPVIYETTVHSHGFAFNLEPLDPGRRGLRWALLGGGGLDNTLRSGVDWRQVFTEPKDARLSYTHLRIEASLWYNFYVTSTTGKGLFLTLGVSVHDYILEIARYASTQGASEKTLNDLEYNDLIAKGWLTIAVRF